MPNKFQLIGDDPLVPDTFVGSADLLAAHGLGKISQVVLSGGNKIENYAQDSFKQFRKGPGLDIAPLADIVPSTIKPTFQPLSSKQLEAFTLEAGQAPSLSDQQLGIPVDSRALLGGPRPTEQQQPAPKPAVKIKVRIGGGTKK